jgi:8-amino-7-oxononanoate synthase
VKTELTIALSRELAIDGPSPAVDIGIRAGVDTLHVLYRSQVVTSFTSWNLLDLFDHKEVRLSAVKALEENSGLGAAAGRFVGGLATLHTACEARVAAFLGAESGLLFSSKNQAVLTLITALSKEGVVVIGPALSTLPLADACSLVELEYAEYENLDELRQLLERYKSSKRVIVVGESMAATTGKILEVPLFLGIVEQSGAWGVLDESAAVAHSGLRGAGSAEQVPASPSLLARLCGCGALVGVEVAAIVGSQELKELLIQRSRYIRVEPPPAHTLVAALSSAIDLVEVAITQRDKLLVRSKMVQSAVRAQGWGVVSDDSVPIVSLWFDTLAKAREVQEALLQRGSVVEALAARSLRKNGAVVRAVLSSAHTDLEVARLLDGLLEIRKRMVG